MFFRRESAVGTYKYSISEEGLQEVLEIIHRNYVEDVADYLNGVADQMPDGRRLRAIAKELSLLKELSFKIDSVEVTCK